MSNTQLLRKVIRKVSSGGEILHRNSYCTSGQKAQQNRVNLEWVDNNNLGDELAPVIFRWMLDRENISADEKTEKTVHLMTVGSMVGAWNFDAVIWGSGIHTFSNVGKLSSMHYIQKFDIRAVRGPVTRQALNACGHRCPEIYGDPAVLMPLIYMPEQVDKKHSVSVVLHYHAGNEWRSWQHIEEPEVQYLNYLNIATSNYKQYVDEMILSEKIISSSLHGIILAESYGIPAVFFNSGGYVNEALMKYYDWYYSTGRYSVKIAQTLEEAIETEPMPLPDLRDMQKRLIEAFPYDLWNNSK